jgi:hypothetical protein
MLLLIATAYFILQHPGKQVERKSKREEDIALAGNRT